MRSAHYLWDSPGLYSVLATFLDTQIPPFYAAEGRNSSFSTRRGSAIAFSKFEAGEMKQKPD